MLPLKPRLPLLHLRQGEQAVSYAKDNPNYPASRVKKRKRGEPVPRNAFPHVVEKVGFFLTWFFLSHLLIKGLVSGAEARELFNM
jgi:hypothetical protein